MSDTNATPSDDAVPPSDIESIESEIADTRAALGATVDQLADKLDVKAQVGRKADSVKHTISDKAAQAKAAAPEPVQHALDSVASKTGPAAHQFNETTRPHRAKIAAGLAVVLVALVVLRRRTGGDDE